LFAPSYRLRGGKKKGREKCYRCGKSRGAPTWGGKKQASARRGKARSPCRRTTADKKKKGGRTGLKNPQYNGKANLPLEYSSGKSWGGPGRGGFQVENTSQKKGEHLFLAGEVEKKKNALAIPLGGWVIPVNRGRGRVSSKLLEREGRKKLGKKRPSEKEDTKEHRPGEPPREKAGGKEGWR